MTVIDVLLTGSGSLREKIAQSTSYPYTPSLPHIWREKKTGVFGLEVETFFQINNATKEKLISDIYEQWRIINPLRQAALQLGDLHTR